MLTDQDLAGMFSVPVVARWAPIESSRVRALKADERAQIGKAVPKRQAEYATARALVREAWAELGLAEATSRSLLNGPDRAPIWPDGITGSITHTDQFCAVVVGEANVCGGLGLDAERAEPLDPVLLPTILRSEERARFEDPVDHRIVFSAKESAYKAQWIHSRVLLEFHDLEMALDEQRSALTATFHRAVPPFSIGSTVHGRVRLVANLVITGFACPRPRASRV